MDGAVQAALEELRDLLDIKSAELEAIDVALGPESSRPGKRGTVLRRGDNDSPVVDCKVEEREGRVLVDEMEVVHHEQKTVRARGVGR